MVIHDWGELPASAPNRDIHIGDGSSYINQFNKKGEYIRTFGGGKTKKEGDLNCPHGIVMDAMAPSRCCWSPRPHGGVKSPCHFDQVQKWRSAGAGPRSPCDFARQEQPGDGAPGA